MTTSAIQHVRALCAILKACVDNYSDKKKTDCRHIQYARM